jgi:transposase
MQEKVAAVFAGIDTHKDTLAVAVIDDAGRLLAAREVPRMAPPQLPASSGRTVRHRFNPGGNRQLNRALYTIAITQIRGDTEGRAYYERKRAAGKTKREALRCLKRRLSDIVFTTMRDDADRQTPQLGQLPRRTRPGWVRPTQTRHD